MSNEQTTASTIHELFEGIDTEVVDGRTWYYECDVCRKLGISDPFLPDIILKERKSKEWKSIGLISYLSESAVYEMALYGKSPIAQEFREWLYNEVLPKIKVC